MMRKIVILGVLFVAFFSVNCTDRTQRNHSTGYINNENTHKKNVSDSKPNEPVEKNATDTASTGAAGEQGHTNVQERVTADSTGEQGPSSVQETSNNPDKKDDTNSEQEQNQNQKDNIMDSTILYILFGGSVLLSLISLVMVFKLKRGLDTEIAKRRELKKIGRAHV